MPGNELAQEVEMLRGLADRLERERDEAQADVKEWQQIAHENKECCDEAKTKIERLEGTLAEERVTLGITQDTLRDAESEVQGWQAEVKIVRRANDELMDEVERLKLVLESIAVKPQPKSQGGVYVCPYCGDLEDSHYDGCPVRVARAALAPAKKPGQNKESKL